MKAGELERMIRRSAFKCHAKQVALPPSQPAHAERFEIVKGQCKFQRNDFQALQANTRPGICDVVNRASMDAGAFAEKQQRALGYSGPSDGPSLTRLRHARTRRT